uniref:non-specific serine/threonine protein kinase n=1 Tax=Anthoceros agrestis TaxID=41834 RepID=A0A386TXC4_9EMBR|nr:CLV1 [Anthoceros agrestis]
MEIKAALVDQMDHLEGWQGNATTACEWKGVSCNAAGRVEELSLAGLNLTGSLSPAVGFLTALTNLSVEQNNFTGTLPGAIANLTRLRFLNVSNNNFSYSFPAGFGALTKLEMLDTYNNNFSGPLPEELAVLPALEHLHLGGSYFEGSIPPSYGNISSLKYLALSGNSLTGRIPAELGNLNLLEGLYLGYFNVYDDGIPPELGKLKNLVRLDLGGCQLTGGIPAELGNLESLDTLFLQFNELTGSIPLGLGNLSNLKSLDTSLNQMSGAIPPDFYKLQKLELLSLFGNQLMSGPIPDFIAALPNLQVLHLWGNQFTGSIPANLGNSTKLIMVDLSNNSLSGVIPPYLCNGALQRLILQINQLSGPIPDSIGSCRSLEYLRLGHNQLNGTIPAALLGLTNLSFLELLDNHLEGPIPQGFINVPRLSRLDLSDNLLDGVLPSNIGSLQSMQYLALTGNRFSGSIPSDIGLLSVLNTVDLSRNYFTGGIPPEIGLCSQLSDLDLSSNQLTAEIPEELSHLPVLAYLNLSRNLLKGPIPEELEDLQTLNIVDFSYNNLSGPIPVSGTFQFFNYSSYVGNPGLCGPQNIIPAGSSACDSPKSTAYPMRSAPHRGGKAAPIAWIVGGLFAAALIVLLVGVCCFFNKYQWYISSILAKDKSIRPWKLTAFQRLNFSANHVLGCLSEDNIIGRGGAGTVYKGEMPDGENIAVKRLPGKATTKGFSHDHGFSAEIQTLGKIRHRNIVRLLGCCSNHETNLLVYEYMPYGSLGEILHGKNHVLLVWNTRYEIALQAAKGLAYLHHDCQPAILHRDVKSNNILLDSNLEAHVADFGLAKLLQNSGTSQSMSSISGSYGYIAPEYAYTLKVNEKSDIYSFGVVLMELITGKRPIEQEFGEGVDIVQWVRGKIQNKDMGVEVLDSRLGSKSLPLQEIMLVLRVALLCTSDLPVDRPTMREVVQMLQDVKPSSNDTKNVSSKPSTPNRKKGVTLSIV